MPSPVSTPRLTDSIGEYKTILQLVGVLSHGKVAKRLTDRAIDLMQDVQNLRKAIYEYDQAPCTICYANCRDPATSLRPKLARKAVLRSVTYET